MDHSPAFLALVAESKKHIRECTVQMVHERLEKGESFVLIDVREDLEWQAGHIPGAVHVGKGVIERDIETKFPNSDTPLVLYCGGGFRSALAAEVLQKMGYTNVTSMDGGMRGWREAGLREQKP
jgi:rhodanese-related sulfurtransferase